MNGPLVDHQREVCRLRFTRSQFQDSSVCEAGPDLPRVLPAVASILLRSTALDLKSLKTYEGSFMNGFDRAVIQLSGQAEFAMPSLIRAWYNPALVVDDMFVTSSIMIIIVTSCGCIQRISASSSLHMASPQTCFPVLRFALVGRSTFDSIQARQ